MRASPLLFIGFCSVAAAATLTEELAILSDTIEQLKEQEKAKSKELHDKISDEIGANIEKIGQNIKGVVNEFNATKNIDVLKNARDNFVKTLAEGIKKAKEAKDSLKEESKAKYDETVGDLLTILHSAQNDLLLGGATLTENRDLASAIARVNGAASWSTAAWLLLALALVLVIAVALTLCKHTTKRTGYNPINA